MIPHLHRVHHQSDYSQDFSGATWIDHCECGATRDATRSPAGTHYDDWDGGDLKTLRLAEFKKRALRATQFASLSHGAANEIPGFREAIEALPDRRRLARLPGDVRVFIETQLALIEGGC